MASLKDTYVVLGAGVIGLTTALELSARHPTKQIIVVAKHLPGDRSSDYTSPWAGANWCSTATDNGPEEARDAVTYQRFAELVNDPSAGRVAGIYEMELRVFYDRPIEDAGVVSPATGKIWYDTLVRDGLRFVRQDELPAGAVVGYDFWSFVIDTSRYLAWLQHKALVAGVDVRRGSYDSLADLFADFLGAKAYFNCTGLGSYHLKDVEDKAMYPTRGQVILVESPKVPLEKQYFRSPRRLDRDTTYVFPRGKNGGVILGGARIVNDWNGEVDLAFAEDIKRRCCALVPELGRPDDLKVLYHGVGLRPSRHGGARIEREQVGDALVVHNYGHSSAGYQASWGSAKDAVDLLDRVSRL